jgi:translation elongation factor EF-1beta
MSKFYVVKMETYVEADDEEGAFERAKEKLDDISAWNITIGPEQEEE